MRRRALLGTLVAGMAAGCVDAAAPSGPRNPPSEADAGAPDPTDPDEGPPAFRIGEWDLEEGDDGRLVVTATVINAAPSERTGVVEVTVTFDEETIEAGTEVTVPPDDEVDVAMPVDVPFDRFEASGSLSLELRRSE